MTEIETLTALNIAQKRIVELIGKTTDDAEIRLLLRDKMTIDEAVKVARNSIQNHTLLEKTVNNPHTREVIVTFVLEEALRTLYLSNSGII